MKVTNKQKLEMAKEHVDDGITLRELSERYQIHISGVKYAVALYQRHGTKVFLERDKIGSYSREQKIDVITRYLKGEKTQRQLALEIGVPDPKIVKDWVDKFKKDGEDSIQTSHRRKSYEIEEEKIKRIESEELQERIKYLEAENEYLKKLHALVLKRTQKQKKK